MKQYTTRTKEVKELNKVICDICGKNVNDYSKDYNTNEVCISHEYGDVWPEGVYTVCLEVDMCGDCFESVILPVLMKANPNLKYKDIS